MTDIQNTLDDSLWPLLAISLFLCLLPPLMMGLHHIMTDPVARMAAPPALWPLMAIYIMIRGSLHPPHKALDYDDPIASTTWIRPDPSLDGAEDPC